jgi:hypothetical protein
MQFLGEPSQGIAPVGSPDIPFSDARYDRLGDFSRTSRMHRNNCRFAFVLAFVSLAIGSGGCGGERRVDVSGRVTYNGSPLAIPGGQIAFVSAGGTQVAASIDLDGTYRATGVPTGPNRVVVWYPNPEARSGKRFPVEGQPPPPPMPPAFLTPYEYASVDTSNLSVEVGDGTTFNADLKGPTIP